MVTILHRELECKVEKVQHMKLEGGGLNREGGLTNFPPLKRGGGVLERGGLFETGGLKEGLR